MVSICLWDGHQCHIQRSKFGPFRGVYIQLYTKICKTNISYYSIYFFSVNTIGNNKLNISIPYILLEIYIYAHSCHWDPVLNTCLDIYI